MKDSKNNGLVRGADFYMEYFEFVDNLIGSL